MEWEQAEHVGVTRSGRAVAPRARGGRAAQAAREDEDALATPPPEQPLAPAAHSGAVHFEEDVARARFPFSVVWTPLPLITWLLPFVGHMGITDSRGVIYDFAGPYTIGVDSFAFGEPVRVLRLRPERASASASAAAAAAAPAANAGAAAEGASSSAAQAWDSCVDRGCDVYVGRMHVMLYDDCHDHVARCLNEMRYGGHARWNKVTLAAMLFFGGAFVTPRRTLAAYLPALVLWTAVALLLRRWS